MSKERIKNELEKICKEFNFIQILNELKKINILKYFFDFDPLKININNNEIDIETFAKEYNDNNLDLFDLPLDFARNKLMVDQSEPISIFLMDKLMKSDSKFFLDEPINENIELDNDSSFADYHSENELLSNVTSGTHVPRRTLRFIKNNYQIVKIN